jgi:hypothetical protein
MDTVSFVLSLIAALLLLALALTVLSFRLWCALRAAQAEIARLVAQSRPRSPQQPYETGLGDVVQVLDRA